MGALTARNLKVFFRDRVSVVMSFFAVLVIIALYALFLGDQLIDSFDSMGIDNSGDVVNSWVIAGIIAVTTMTSCLGALGVMVEDRANGVERDFIVSPLKRSEIAASYAISTYCVGAILSLMTFVVGELYIWGTGGTLLTGQKLVQAVLGILLAVASSGSIVLFITSFLRTMGAYSMVSLVVGVAIGFITGVYIPIGSISDEVATAVKVFPVSYSSSYMRILMTEEPLAEAFTDIPGNYLEEIQEELGIFYTFDGTRTDLQTAVWVMVITAFVFFALSCISFSMKRKKL